MQNVLVAQSIILVSIHPVYFLFNLWVVELFYDLNGPINHSDLPRRWQYALIWFLDPFMSDKLRRLLLETRPLNYLVGSARSLSFNIEILALGVNFICRNVETAVLAVLTCAQRGIQALYHGLLENRLVCHRFLWEMSRAMFLKCLLVFVLSQLCLFLFRWLVLGVTDCGVGNLSRLRFGRLLVYRLSSLAPSRTRTRPRYLMALLSLLLLHPLLPFLDILDCDSLNKIGWYEVTGATCHTTTLTSLAIVFHSLQQPIYQEIYHLILPPILLSLLRLLSRPLALSNPTITLRSSTLSLRI